MLDRLALYLDMIVAQCLPAAPGAPPTLVDYLFTLIVAGLALLALVSLLRGLAGRDDPRSQRIKRAILDD